jgi:flagellar biogenesis protein FliO
MNLIESIQKFRKEIIIKSNREFYKDRHNKRKSFRYAVCILIIILIVLFLIWLF